MTHKLYRVYTRHTPLFRRPTKDGGHNSSTQHPHGWLQLRRRGNTRHKKHQPRKRNDRHLCRLFRNRPPRLTLAHGGLPVVRHALRRRPFRLLLVLHLHVRVRRFRLGLPLRLLRCCAACAAACAPGPGASPSLRAVCLSRPLFPPSPPAAAGLSLALPATAALCLVVVIAVVCFFFVRRCCVIGDGGGVGCWRSVGSMRIVVTVFLPEEKVEGYGCSTAVCSAWSGWVRPYARARESRAGLIYARGTATVGVAWKAVYTAVICFHLPCAFLSLSGCKEGTQTNGSIVNHRIILSSLPKAETYTRNRVNDQRFPHTSKINHEESRSADSGLWAKSKKKQWW